MSLWYQSYDKKIEKIYFINSKKLSFLSNFHECQSEIDLNGREGKKDNLYSNNKNRQKCDFSFLL